MVSILPYQALRGWAGARVRDETAYELGMAHGIATLGSIVTGFYRGFAATQAAAGLPNEQGPALLAAAQGRSPPGCPSPRAPGAC
jgi:DHA2 family multidrug resistance protein-like MFS transporter